jgi:hypothetical protein
MGLILALAILASGTTTQQGGVQGTYQERVTEAINHSVQVYLHGSELHSVLTPGEHNDWPLKLHSGQVVFAEAESEAFDPAIEIVDSKGVVQTKNDDRYPGDQRPLVMWRCSRDGDYFVRVRCFQNRSGGQFGVRYTVYDSVDLGGGGLVEQEVDGRAPLLLRVPMKAGQIKTIHVESPGGKDYMPLTFNAVIAPDGLPEESPSLAAPISPAIQAFIAPVDGDYYLMYTPAIRQNRRRLVHVGAHAVVPQKLSRSGEVLTGMAPTNTPTIFALPVKAGELFEATAIGLSPDCAFELAEVPDVSKYSLATDETNPFIPHEKEVTTTPGFDTLPARARDGRVMVFRARRDTTLWLASNGEGQPGKQFTVKVAPAAASLSDAKTNEGTLRIAYTDYWDFEAKVGDVMILKWSAQGFDPVVTALDPKLDGIFRIEDPLDVTSDRRQLVIQQPGRYLLSMAAYGDGAAGTYALDRKVVHAKEFSVGSPATGEISEGQVQVWRFTARPDQPMLIHWNSSHWNYGADIYNDRGERTGFQREQIDDHNQLGILKVNAPQTFLIVLTGVAQKASYKIDLNPIPAYK